MPYISPKGALARSAPAQLTSRDKAKLSDGSTPNDQNGPARPAVSQSQNIGQINTEKPVYLIYEEDARPMDPQVVDELAQWKGWSTERESPRQEDEVDPLEGKVVELAKREEASS